MREHFAQTIKCGVCGRDSVHVDPRLNYTPCELHSQISYLEYTHYQYNHPKSHWSRLVKRRELGLYDEYQAKSAGKK